MNAPHNTQTLDQLIDARLSCIVRLEEYSKRQAKLVEDQEITTLLDLLAEKQKTLALLERIERAIDPFRDEDPEQRKWASPELRIRCSEKSEKCETLLAQIFERDRRSEQLLSAKRDHAAQMLQETHHASQTRGAYIDKTKARANFNFDA